MPGESFRFIHASDFHLESPLGDLDSLPSHLRDAMADAPRRAAQAVFEAALADNIDFLVLCGDLISPQVGGPTWHGVVAGSLRQTACQEHAGILGCRYRR